MRHPGAPSHGVGGHAHGTLDPHGDMAHWLRLGDLPKLVAVVDVAVVDVAVVDVAVAIV